MLFGETVAVYCENHTEHTNTLCGHFSPYLTGNTLRLRYGAQLVNAVLGKQSLFIVRTIRNTQIHCVETSVRTSQETHYVSATEPNRLMLFGETVAVYCENHMEHTNTRTLCGQNAKFVC
jgi:hypothetical protein